MKMVICTQCGEDKPKEKFYKSKRMKRGFRSECIKCSDASMKRYYHKNKDRMNEYQRNRYNSYYKQQQAVNSINYRHTPKGKYTYYKANAKRKELDFDLTLEEFTNIITKPCYYCGENGSLNGVDRLNPLDNYYIDNCVPCCWICNKIKMDLPLKEFLIHIDRIYNHNIILDENKNI